MLQFKVFSGSEPASTWPLINAHLLERDDHAVRGEITLADGVIRCRRRGREAAALSLMHDAGPMGRLQLQTCLLPDRDEPYLLSLELARHRIKQFIAKSEEWQMFDLDADHDAMRLWEQARRLFTSAINETDPVAADRHASASLVSAVEASEQLALSHAEILLHRRFGSRAASSTTLGFRLWPGTSGAAMESVLERDADVLMLPVRWSDLEVAEGTYDWGPLDRWMAWAQERKRPIVAGPLLDFSEGAVPPWIKVWQHDYDTCRDLVYDHLLRVVSRYRQVVGLWNLASGLNVNDQFEFSADQMLDLVRMTSLLVREQRKGARCMIELAHPFGEHTASRRDSLAPLQFLDRLTQEGIQFSCLGVQILFGGASTAGHARDLMQISGMLDRFLLLEKPVMITALGVPAAPGPEECGFWHGAWSPALQNEWITSVFPIVMSKPFVEAVFWGALADHPGMLVPGLGLLDEHGAARPALAKLVGMRRRLKRPLGVARGSGSPEVLTEVDR